MSYNNKTVEIRRGQALNLAHDSAVARGRDFDMKYIVEIANAKYHMIKAWQDFNPDEIAKFVDNPRIQKAQRELSAAMDKLSKELEK